MGSTGRMVVGAFGLVALAVGFLAVVFLTAPAAPGPDLARAKTSVKGLYSVAIAPETSEPRQGDLHSWIVTVTTRQGTPVDNASFTIGGGMPEHAHGLPTSPEATAYLGDGRYRIEGMKFSMTGWWQLKFGITAPVGPDEATFNLVL
ncbi:FixH family protein [Aminobacter sp. P9b]|uniref:FixH family protein n=1 Tax=Aminobacter sp. P9b TaxID=3133697 RepID=UPI00324B4ADE